MRGCNRRSECFATCWKWRRCNRGGSVRCNCIRCELDLKCFARRLFIRRVLCFAHCIPALPQFRFYSLGRHLWELTTTTTNHKTEQTTNKSQSVLTVDGWGLAVGGKRKSCRIASGCYLFANCGSSNLQIVIIR